MFLDFLGWQGSEYFGGDAFLMNGGDRTLASYDYFAAERTRRSASSRCPRSTRSSSAVSSSIIATGTTCSCTRASAAHLLGETDVEWALRRAHTEDLLWDRATRGSAPPAGRDDRLRAHAERRLRRCAGTRPSASASTPARSTAAASPRSACPTRRSFRSRASLAAFRLPARGRAGSACAGLDHGNHHLRAGAQRAEVEIRVVLAQQPDRDVELVLRQEPERLALLRARALRCRSRRRPRRTPPAARGGTPGGAARRPPA